jgi:hypothetical protein
MAASAWRSVTAWLSRRPAVVPLLALAVLVIVVAAGPSPADDAWAGMPNTDWVSTVILVVIGLMAALGLVILLAVRPAPATRTTQKRTFWHLLVLIGIAYLFSLADIEGALVSEEQVPPVPAPDPEPDRSAPDAGSDFGAGDGAVVILVLAAALVVVWWARRGAEPEPDEDESLAAGEDDLGSAMGRAARHLLDRDDPRHAVLLAYRDLELTLERLDRPRRPAETPIEHLRRALTELAEDRPGLADPERAGPLLDLAALYQRARFSAHVITGDEQQRAGLALERARASLVTADR